MLELSCDVGAWALQQVAGTVETMRAAVSDGIACHVGGGTHHAFRDRGSGFTIFNDLAIAARVALKEGLSRRCLIVDLDVHQVHVKFWIWDGN
jgi:acetoin utilization deacetylase AcuC-like enzyme